MRYFEKVFDGQVIKWCVNGAELGGGKPTLLCLVSNETEAESCLSKRSEERRVGKECRSA